MHTHGSGTGTMSIRVRNWCIPWENESGADAYIHWAMWACMSGTDVCAEHTRQELMPMLSIHIRNKRCLASPKNKIICLYFRPKLTYSERFYGVKIIENPTLGHLKINDINFSYETKLCSFLKQNVSFVICQYIELFIEDQAFRGRMIRLLAHPHPVSNLSHFLNLPVCRRSSWGSGEEPNHTTARKLGPL